MSQYAALASRIRVALQDVELSVRRSFELGGKAKTSGDDGYWDGVALNLHGFYTGVEPIFEDIARTIEQSAPSGSGWHMDLLTQMSGEMDELRPAVISQTTRLSLDEFRGLRHVVRNVYAFNLRSARLNELLAHLPDSFNAVKNDLLAFAEFLETI
jgi:hypothetical protein